MICSCLAACLSQGPVCLQIQDTDIDTLERCCAAMAFGDLEAEAPHSLTETSFLRLFRLAQLTVEYLLHIQDRLVWENGLLKVAILLIVWRIQSCSMYTAALWWGLGDPANVLSALSSQLDQGLWNKHVEVLHPHNSKDRQELAAAMQGTTETMDTGRGIVTV